PLRQELEQTLSNSWNEDPAWILRIIWNLRSIHDGKGEKEAFYCTFGWLYDHNSRTSISNLHFLTAPPSLPSTKSATSKNLCFCMLHCDAPKSTAAKKNDKETTDTETNVKAGTPESRIAAARLHNDKQKAKAATLREVEQLENHCRLADKLTDPKRLLDESNTLQPGDNERVALLEKISLAGKWAPTPNCSRDKVTNISTAISELMYSARGTKSYPAALNKPLPHDLEGFEAYPTSVEHNKRTISGAKLMPHKPASQIVSLHQAASYSSGNEIPNPMREFKKKLAQTQARVVKSQWKTLINNFRDSGSIENSIAICDLYSMSGADWGFIKGIRAVFLNPLLPLAVEQEDMIKRLFIFSDMQFDTCQELEARPTQWATNYDVIEQAYKEANSRSYTGTFRGSRDGPGTVEVETFMDEVEEPESKTTLSEGENDTTMEQKQEKKKVFNPINAMKKALMQPSFDGLVAVD
ncbi:hypothetical protein CVT25_003581, partial [Psilocybe cyanescens]